MTTTLTPPPLDVSATAPTPFTRLVRLEWRKMMDTRSGFWMLLCTGILLVLAMVITLLVAVVDDGTRLSASSFSEIMTIPVSLLVPVFAVLIVTSEWSQRTHLVTFAHEPHRLRVLRAKLIAVCALAVATIALAIVLGGVGNMLYGVLTGNDVVWDLEPTRLLGVVVVQTLFFLMGFGLASLLLNTPGAVAVFYLVGLLLPVMVYSTLYFVFDWADEVIPWFDLSTATLPWVSDTDYRGEPFEIGGTEWAQATVAVLVWVVAPLVLGALRVRRSEVK